MLARRVLAHESAGRVHLRFRHRVHEPTVEGGAVVGVTGEVLADDDAERGEGFLTDATLEGLVRKMDVLVGDERLDPSMVADAVAARDEQVISNFGKDVQAMAIRNARRSLGERLLRVAGPHRLLDPAVGPLVAVRLRALTRKTLDGLETDLQGRVLGTDGAPLPGLYAVGEVVGFGGGGMHGYRSLEGTFLGGCLFGGRMVGWMVGRMVGRSPGRSLGRAG